MKKDYEIDSGQYFKSAHEIYPGITPEDIDTFIMRWLVPVRCIRNTGFVL